MDVDEALIKFDGNGRQQMKFTVAVGMVNIGGAFVNLGMEFLGYIPESFECIRSNATGDVQVLVNSCFNNSAELCDHISFHTAYTSVATEWGLVCDRAANAKFLQSLFMLGMMTASPMIGPLSDAFGRLRVALIMMVMQAILMTGLAAVPSYGAFAILRYLSGILTMAGVVLFTLNTELVQPGRRSSIGLIGSAFFSLGLVVIAFAAYMSTSWRLLVAIGAGIICALTCLVVASPRWLLQKGRTQEARAVLVMIARSNNIAVGPDLELRAASNKHQSTGDNCCSIFRYRRLAYWSLVLFFNWAVHTLTYYGLTSAAANMGHGRFSSFVLSALVELPPLLVIVYLMERAGRRYTLSGMLALTGLSCSLIWLLPRTVVDQYGGRMVLSLIGKMGVSTSFTVSYVVTGEIYPTSIRNTGLGINNVFSRLAGVVYPFALLLNSVQQDAHFLLFGVLALASAGCDLLLPETRGKQLPDTVDQLMSATELRSPVGSQGQMYTPLHAEDVEEPGESVDDTELNSVGGENGDSDEDV